MLWSSIVVVDCSLVYFTKRTISIFPNYPWPNVTSLLHPNYSGPRITSKYPTFPQFVFYVWSIVCFVLAKRKLIFCWNADSTSGCKVTGFKRYTLLAADSVTAQQYTDLSFTATMLACWVPDELCIWRELHCTPVYKVYSCLSSQPFFFLLPPLSETSILCCYKFFK